MLSKHEIGYKPLHRRNCVTLSANIVAAASNCKQLLDKQSLKRLQSRSEVDGTQSFSLS